MTESWEGLLQYNICPYMGIYGNTLQACEKSIAQHGGCDMTLS